MPVISKTRYEIRHQMMARVGDGLPVGQTFTPTASGSATHLRCTDVSGPGDDYLNNWKIFIYSGNGAGTEKLITDFDDSDSDISWTGALTSTTEDSLFELHRPGFPSVQAYNTAIDMAIQEVARKALNPQVDKYMAFERDRREYRIPSNFVHVAKIVTDETVIGGDRHPSYDYDGSQDLRQASGNVQVSQGFQLDAKDAWIDGVYVYIRKLPMNVTPVDPSQSLVVEFRVDSGGSPSATLVGDSAGNHMGARTNAVAPDAIQREFGYVYFQLPRAYFFGKDTAYHMVIREAVLTTEDANKYYQLGVDTGGGYSKGSLKTANSASSWSAATGSSLIFRVMPAYYRSYSFGHNDWDILQSSTRMLRVHREPVDGAMLQVEGQRFAAEPTLDSSIVDVEASKLTDIAVGRIATQIPRVGLDGRVFDANEAIQRGLKAASDYRQLQVTPNSRTVEPH